MPDRYRRDLDNVCKAMLDALGHAGVYQDDSQIDRLEIVRGAVRAPGAAVVMIEEIKHG
jgi:crossover junction endodeoxyribonuclease RusA